MSVKGQSEGYSDDLTGRSSCTHRILLLSYVIVMLKELRPPDSEL